MNKTSFGFMDIILKRDNKIAAEYLIFEKEGRSHKHPRFESFFVLKGSGQVISGEKVHQVSPGSLVTIPPHTQHSMIPEQGNLEGLLWYHEQPIKREE
jgi:mannose-6-phosphate isomerase-like protein (cupin superfamily)